MKNYITSQLTLWYCLVISVSCSTAHISRRDDFTTCLVQSSTIYNTCYSDLNSHFDDIPQNGVVPILDEETLQNVCVAYHEGDACLQDYATRCVVYFSIDFSNINYEGFNASYRFLCDVAREEYLESIACYNNTALIAADEQCNATLQSNLNMLAMSGLSNEFLDFCGFIDEFLDCIEETTSTHCDPDSARWYRTITTKNLEPFYRQQPFNCRLNTTSYLYYEPELLIPSQSTTSLPTSSTSHSSNVIPMVTGAGTTTSGRSGIEGDTSTSEKEDESKFFLSTPIIVVTVTSICVIAIATIFLVVLKCKHKWYSAHNRSNASHGSAAISRSTFYANNAHDPNVHYFNGANPRAQIQLPAYSSSDPLKVTVAPVAPPAYSYISPTLPAYNSHMNSEYCNNPPPPYSNQYLTALQIPSSMIMMDPSQQPHGDRQGGFSHHHQQLQPESARRGSRRMSAVHSATAQANVFAISPSSANQSNGAASGSPRESGGYDNQRLATGTHASQNYFANEDRSLTDID